ncbi:MAG: BamA/TamA family outer membrane protein [Muribaculaceae bacterium]|nr:BamA/TamA family outer membrane protein [Muribaculaceae bacterium]
MAKLCKYLFLCVWLLLSAACSTTRHIPEGQYLLDRSSIRIDGKGDALPRASDLNNYLRQHPNSRALGILPIRLYTYNWSGNDTSRRVNRWLRNLGEAPVVYNQRLTDASAAQLRQALVNRGYVHASVQTDTLRKGRKISVCYTVTPGEPLRIASLSYQIPDAAVGQVIKADSLNSGLHLGDLLDRTNIDAERTRITDLMRRNGYYDFLRDHISFTADTLANSTDAALTMYVKSPKGVDSHKIYTIRRVIFEPDYSPEGKTELPSDTIPYRDIYIIRNRNQKSTQIAAKTLWNNNFIEPDAPYNASQFNLTYEALARLGIIKSVAVEMQQVGPGQMDAIIRLQRNSLQGISLELEGTNSEGDLGIGAGVTYQHRNIFHGSELLTLKGHGSYESLSGNLEGLINNHYTEANAEVAVTLPHFSMPFIKRSYRRTVLASTEFSLNGNYQERPEYTRIIAGAGWRYKWTNRANTNRRVFDLLDVNYVFLPRSTINFLDEVAAGNPLLRYSYEDHFIMRMGYSFFLTNRSTAPLLPGQSIRREPRNVWTVRASAESAGNLLYAISSAIGQRRHDDAYKIFGTQYAQYVKGEADFMVKHTVNHRTSLAFRVGAGVAVPYGNSSMVPFEKRFYAGGANGVRGWSVRTLGPGRYDARNSVTDFINQCGDIRIDLNLEARVKLFWVLEGAAFIDAGNVWTIRKYENQPGGLFRFGSFYKELGWAYGLGIRMDFTYFLLRFDLGMKAYNPAINQEPWPLVHPNWHRDATFHFSVGYPF